MQPLCPTEHQCLFQISCFAYTAFCLANNPIGTLSTHLDLATAARVLASVSLCVTKIQNCTKLQYQHVCIDCCVCIRAHVGTQKRTQKQKKHSNLPLSDCLNWASEAEEQWN
jgi:hypothetical protein